MQQAEGQPSLRRAHHCVCGRDSPLQQSTAGRFSALCGKGQHYPNRRDNPKTRHLSSTAPFCRAARCLCCKALTTSDLTSLLSRVLTDPRGFGAQKIQIEPDMLEAIANFANGDARTALSTLEMLVLNSDTDGKTVTVTRETLEQCISKKSLLYDKTGEEHYNLISALHKSMRNSDPDAAVYWLARMLEAGEDPLYIARRVIRFASEDVGMGRFARARNCSRSLSGVPFYRNARMQRAFNTRGGLSVACAQV